jgi:hypothetical protein
MPDYWCTRMRQAQHEARAAPNDDIRQVYLQLSEHYRSMIFRIDRKAMATPRPDAKSSFD